MLHKTRGIVFKTIPYAESSVIAHIYTEKFGMQAYLINGVKKPKAKISGNMLQALHLLDMVVYHKPHGNLQRIAELKNAPVLQHIPYHIVKSAIALFLNEVLYKAVKHPAPDEPLFEYLFRSVELLDTMTAGLGNFHLYFLIRLTRYLGFYPDTGLAASAPFFDLKNGIYTAILPNHSWILQRPHTEYLNQLLQCSAETLERVHIPLAEKRFLLSRLLDYYRLHIDDLGEIKSHRILEELLS
ncbi:DNA repair protein RecO (plasmid) [Pedobacter sp. BS3]|uniref:DNA repair protein RecO n=1 Tax=Pedobacter sp. BS3 TaxID=2567937 RepID=UPI0011EE7399|nr:DNA repair protein RecO [Pedobacter sp. BS3]TZF85804.1 DNA repair protein RecO [Pedobacter sp. BS3]